MKKRAQSKDSPLPANILADVLNGAPGSIQQLLDYYEKDIKRQVKKILQNDIPPYYSQEDLTQDIKLQLIQSVQNLRIKLQDINLDSDNN